MDICKCIVPLWQGGTLNISRASSPLVRLVEGEERWEVSDPPQGVLPQNWDGTQLNRTVTFMVLKDTANDKPGSDAVEIRVGADRRGKIADISLIAGKEFRNWVVKDLDPLSQAVPIVKKRRRNIVLSFAYDSVTIARLKTYKLMDYWSTCFPQGSSNSFHEKLGGYMSSAYLLAHSCIIIKLGVRINLKTYNGYRAIGAQRERDQMGRDRQGWPKNKRSKKELGGERREVYKESERA
ncbi:uncharacterized protein TNCV_3253571 [Trichonephila clavipes]|nr:uncharacterized protein TNCV_3253571 [Trichonephila clavipes]